MTRTARRQIDVTLPEAAACACLEFIYGPLAQAPYRVGGPLSGPFEGQRRARRGEYRVRYVIDDEAMVVRVLDVDHRRDIYRRSLAGAGAAAAARP